MLSAARAREPLARRAAMALPALLLAAAAAAGCASSGTRADGAGPGGGRVVDEGAGTPRREASTRLVERGEELLAADRPEEAAILLERAARVDPSNGFAFLALARARLAGGETERALGLLERASTLLRAHPEAAARADSLLEVARSAGGGG